MGFFKFKSLLFSYKKYIKKDAEPEIKENQLTKIVNRI